MRDPLSRNFSSVRPPSQDSWLQRVRDNFRQLLTPSRIFPSSANGAPLHLLRLDSSPGANRAHGVSLLTHAAMIAALGSIAVHTYKTAKTPGDGVTNVLQHLKFPPHFAPANTGTAPDPGSGSGGGRVPIPATAGNLVPLASIQLVRPSLPPKPDVQLPVPPTIFDAAAAPVLTPVNKIGLPWMKDATGSPGPGDSNTIRAAPVRTMRDRAPVGPRRPGESLTHYRPGHPHHR